jgi:hypothetical protein
MLEARIIASMEELDCISPMVVQPKKTRNIRIYVDLCILIATCLHNPFLTPFIDEVLENMGGRGAN